MNPFRWAGKCTNRIKGCHLEGVLPFVYWEKAHLKAQELNVLAGPVPGLHPYRWQTPDLNIILFYPDYTADPDDIVFFAYNRKAQMMHIGHTNTRTKFECISSRDLFHNNKHFRGELLGVKVTRTVNKKTDDSIMLS